MTRTTFESITDEQIRALRNEAAMAGDRFMVETCDRALGGDMKAISDCAEVIADARAQVDRAVSWCGCVGAIQTRG